MQTSAVTNGVGTMGMGDVVNVTVTCSLNTTSLSTDTQEKAPLPFRSGAHSKRPMGAY